MVFTSNWKAASSPSTQQNSSNYSINTSTQSSMGSPFVMSPSAFAAAQHNNSSNNNSGGMGGYNSNGGTNTRPFIGAQSTINNNMANNTNNMMGASSQVTNNNTNKADFNSLLANSSSLLSSIGRNNSTNHQSTPNTGTQQINTGTTASGVLGDKSLLELSVASRTGGSSSFNTNTSNPLNNTNNSSMGSQQQQQTQYQQTSNYEKESAAHRLLARDGIGFDSVKLGKLTRDLENRSTTSNTTGGSNLSGSGGYYGSGGYGGMDVEEEKKDDYYDPTNNTDTNLFDGHSKHVLSSLQGTSMKEILDNHHDYLCKSAVRQGKFSSILSFIYLFCAYDICF